MNGALVVIFIKTQTISCKMTKTDQSKHNICLAAIKRKTIKPYDFKWTRFYESNAEFAYVGLPFDLAENELYICSVMIDADNYSILTTQRLITTEKGQMSIGIIEESKINGFGDFKGHDDGPLTLGQLLLSDGFILNYFMETGRASMVMIHALQKLFWTKNLTVVQIEKVTRIWNKQNDNRL